MSFNPVHADSLTTNVIVKPSLKITIPTSTLSSSLDPAIKPFESKSLNVTVATNNANGYKLYLDSTNNTTNLVNTIDSTKYIETLSSSTTQDSFPVNSWGYRINSTTSSPTGDSSITSSTNYYPFVSNKLISSSSVATNAISSTLDFATKIDYEKPAGQYNIALNFKALPQTTTYYMQDFAADPTLKDTVCTEEPTMVMDKRDGHTYAIAKLKDGKCWMLQNLRLGENLEPVTGSMTLTSEDTNISSTDGYNPRSEFVLTNQVADGVMPGLPTASGSWIWDNSAFYCTTNYGCYYNFYTATAGIKAEGEDAVTVNNTDVTTSICPAGWTMPTGGEHIASGENQHSSDWQLLANAYGVEVDSYAVVSKRLLVNPVNAVENINGASAPGLLLGGSHYTSGAGGVGAASTYQSRTVRSSGVNYMFSLYNGSITSTATNNRCDARSVRCLAQ